MMEAGSCKGCKSGAGCKGVSSSVKQGTNDVKGVGCKTRGLTAMEEAGTKTTCNGAARVSGCK